jgi:GDP-L-fucose synthase
VILITGGTGFVGRHVQARLRRLGIPHAAFGTQDFDLTRWEGVEAVFAAHRDATTILHCASYQAAGDFPAKHPAEQFRINNLIHLNVLEGWRRFAPQAKLVGLGSSCAYPSAETSLTEDRFMDGEIHGSVYAYAFTKRLLWRGIAAYNDQYTLDGSYLIPATMYGEYDDFHPETAHVSGALIGRFVRAVREGLAEVEVWGDGSQVREFMDVEEFVDVLLHVLPRIQRDIVNVGPGRGVTIRALVEAIRDATGYRGQVRFNPDRYIGIKEKFMNTTKLTRQYGWTVPGDLSRGIARTVEWYTRHYEQNKYRRKFAVPAISDTPEALATVGGPERCR